MRVLLAYACSPSPPTEPFGARLPTGLSYCAAALGTAEIPCAVMNLSGISAGRIRSLVKGANYDIVGVSLFAFNVKETKVIVSAVRKALPSCIIIAGGPLVTTGPQEVLELMTELDAVVVGEGEQPLVELTTRTAAGDSWFNVPGLVHQRSAPPKLPPPPSPIPNLDVLASPSRALYDAGVSNPADFSFLVTSRGSTEHHSGCSSPALWPASVRYHSPQWIKQELLERQEIAGSSLASLRDDSFAHDSGRVLNLCELLSTSLDFHILWDCQARPEDISPSVANALARAGCRTVHLGVEHGSLSMRRLLGKPENRSTIIEATSLLRKAGIEAAWYLLTAIPDETPEDRQATRALVNEGRPHDTILSPLTIYPGSSLWQDRYGSAVCHDGTSFAQVLDEAEVTRVMTEEKSWLEAAAERHAIMAAEVRSAYERLHKPWPLAVALARIHVNAGRFEWAENALRSCSPPSPRYWIDRTLADVLIKTDRPREAIKRAIRAAEILPRCASIRVLLARAYRLRGWERQYEYTMEIARRLNPHDALVHEETTSPIPRPRRETPRPRGDLRSSRPRR